MGGSLLNEYYQRNFTMPDGLDAGALGATSFPAAVQIGSNWWLRAILLGLLLEAAEAFVIGMTITSASSIISPRGGRDRVPVHAPRKARHADAEE